ncbi:MAG: winged helix-turn-helix transcriptional regulator [Rhodoferax sp.]|nr:winged helix-turn-helix transcriptional regulator [Rhodoferax sp.]
MSNNNAPAETGLALDRFSFLVHLISTRIGLIGYRLCRENDINHFSARILVLLLEREDLRISDLVESLVLPQSTISSQLQILQRKGLIRRRRSRKDSRSVFISLSPTGLPLAQACDALSRRANQDMMATLSPEEQQMASDILHRINAQLILIQDSYLDQPVRADPENPTD